MIFKAVVHHEKAGGYWGEVTALPGCYSQGESIEELTANLREAAIGYLELLTNEGRSPEQES